MNNKKKLAFICGSPRSGSTLLYNSICSSNIFNKGLTENHFIPNIIKLLKKQLLRNDKENHMHFEDNQTTINFFINIINDYLEKLYSRYEVNNLCLKSIMFSTEANFISKLLPSVYLIFIVRDPKDIISSMLNVSQKQIEMGLKPNYPRNMESLCNFINSHYEFILKKENFETNKNIILIKYEDLTIDILNKLNFIFKNLNVEYTFRNKEDLWKRAPNFSNPLNNPYHSDLWTKKPTAIKVGSYKQNLTIEEINYINKSCEKLITTFEY